MTSLSQRRLGFISASVYRRREPHAFTYLSERATFWIAIISVFAFVTGNMIGQHGWAVFWKSVMGEGIESTIVFTGMTPPVAQVPDLERWGRLGGEIRTHTFRQVPRDLLIPLPTYVAHGDDLSADPMLRQIYFVEHLGTYENGRGKGSHVGVDISVPEGTPVLSVANGVVANVDTDSGGFGNYVVLKHPNIPVDGRQEKTAIYSAYAHLSSVLVTEGTVVKKGEEIALSGQTGNASAPHLHFQMDKSEAPFHPYWTFSGSEQRRAGWSFSQAINRGLNRERGIEHTLDPMLTVQAYATYQAPMIVVDTSVASSSLTSSARPRMTVADRRQARVAKRGPVATLVAFAETQTPLPSSVSTSSATSLASSVAPVGIGTIRSIRISHDGSYGKERGWERVTLQLLDDQGRVVVSSSANETLYLRTAFGKAEFKPAAVPLSAFRRGVAQVEMLPLGDQTVVVRVEPTGDMSGPMKYLR